MEAGCCRIGFLSYLSKIHGGGPQQQIKQNRRGEVGGESSEAVEVVLRFETLGD
jgi:hypothetical protein